MEVEIFYLQSNIQCENCLTRKDLHNTRLARLELTECKKELETLKEKISKLKRKREGSQQVVCGYIETTCPLTEDLSQLRGTRESWVR